MSTAKKAEREAAEQAMTPAERAKKLTDRDEVTKTYIEKGGELLGHGGVPQADNIAKVAGVLSMTGNRVYIATKVSQALARIAATGDSAKQGLAVLRATVALHQGVRRGIPKDVVARIEKMADDAMQGGRRGR